MCSSRSSKTIRMLFLGMLFSLLLCVSASAVKTKKTGWFSKNGYWYHHDAKYNKARGLCTIGKKQYFFDKKGRQRLGWRKIGKSYYYFQYKNGKKGYMLKNKKVNLIRLGKDGKAVTRKSLDKRRVKMFAAYTLWADQITKPGMSVTDRIYACGKTIADFSYREEEVNIPYDKYWDVSVAEEAYQLYKAGYYHYECWRSSVGFAYLCIGAGIPKVEIHIGAEQHGWVLIDGDGYDAARYGTQGRDRFPVTESQRLSDGHHLSLSVRKLWS